MAGGVGLGRSVGAYAALVRVPNLFTAPPDVLLGAALAVAAGAPVRPGAVAGAAVASTLLYAGGTTLNDYFDAPVDAAKRPERPIPSGRVARRRALALGAAFLAGGALVALVAAGGRAAAVAALLALVVVLYDGVLKGGPAGFAAMGSARGLNVLLGTAAVATLDGLPWWVYGVPAAIGGYIAAVTFMAAEEAAGASRGRVAVAAGGAALAGLAAPALLWGVRPGDPVGATLGTALAAGFLVWTGRALAAAYADPAPEVVGPAVGTCVLGLVVLDAAFAAGAGAGWSLLALGFLVPAVGLARAFDVS